MTHVSDKALRRWAWALLSFFAGVLISRGTISLVEPRVRDGNGAVVALGEVGIVLLVASFPVTALVILRSKPRNRIGWLLMAIGAVWTLSALADGYARYALLVNPGSLPQPGVAAVLNAVSWAPGLGLMGTFLILLFPDGRLPSPRWRPVAWLSAATVAALTVTLLLTPGELDVGAMPSLRNPFGLESARSVLTVLLGFLLPLLPICIGACALGVVLRFRRSRGVERLQLKWLTTAGALVALLFLFSFSVSLLSGSLSGDTQPEWMDVLDAASFLSFLLIPVAIGTAVLRHKLYDIDLVINRALVYGSLTVTLAITYVGSVLVLQQAVSPVTSESDLAVAGSTLVVAALFRPARSRIQAAVDRRFYRSRYDAAKTLDAFAVRLGHELDLDSVGADLRATVDETVQPAHLSLWLRP
ncbi:MAG: hypothetical protein ACRDPJ_20295 [Nocardioidaceae bacterium]